MPNILLLDKSLEFLDDFVAGWNLHKCNTDLKTCRKIQQDNNDLYKSQGKTEKIARNMEEGWISREIAIEVMKQKQKELTKKTE